MMVHQSQERDSQAAYQSEFRKNYYGQIADFLTSLSLLTRTCGMACVQHRHKGFRIREAMVCANLDQRNVGKPAVADQFLAFAEWDDIVAPGMQNDSTRFHPAGRSPAFPGRAQQDQWY